MIVGIDPGKTTGIAVWNDGALDLSMTGEYDVTGVYSFLDRHCGEFGHQQVEWFTISERTTKTSIDYSAIHLIGAVQFAAWRCGHPVSYSRPAEAKTQFPDAALRQAGFWHRSDHVRDATRHLCMALVSMRLIDPLQFLLTD
jgi:hypothetical protein